VFVYDIDELFDCYFLTKGSLFGDYRDELDYSILLFDTIDLAEFKLLLLLPILLSLSVSLFTKLISALFVPFSYYKFILNFYYFIILCGYTLAYILGYVTYLGILF
jgi:hypothetical protein